MESLVNAEPREMTRPESYISYRSAPEQASGLRFRQWWRLASPGA
jgi:hypothetical protein